MAGEEIAFRRASVGLPVSEVSRVLDNQRPTASERITITTATIDQCVGGGVFGAGATFSSAIWIATNRAVSMPFVVEHNMVAVKMFCYNGTAVSGNMDLGIYDENAVLLVSIGSTAQTGTSVIQSFDITDTPLKRGVYYLAMVMDNNTGTTFRAAPSAAGAIGALQQATAFPLPNPAVWVAFTSSYVPIMGVTGRTVV